MWRKQLCLHLPGDEMNTVKAQGQLRHCFWGTYEATIALWFRDEPSARDARKVLGDWNHGENDSATLVWHGKEDDLERTLTRLEKFGASRNDMTSINKSIDFGEPFEVVIPVVPEEQLEFDYA